MKAIINGKVVTVTGETYENGIVLVEDGKIEAVGTHNELKENSEVYREIFVSQQEGVLAQ